jgi:hypothetical protein
MVLAHVAQGDPHVSAHNAERDAINDLQTTVDGLEAGGGSYDAAGAADAARAFAIQRVNHTGTQTADTVTDGTTNKAFLATERTKLAGVATGATANSPDATLLARANHTGTQAASTVTGLAAVATSGAYSDLLGIPNGLATVVYSGSLTTARPTSTTVMWINFPSQPTNMLDNDVWIDPTTGGVLLSGSAAPTGSVGNDGDFYIRTSNSTLYGPKAAGTWPTGVSLIGPAGTNGTGVPTGGTTGQVLAKNSNTNFDTAWVTASGGGGSYIPDHFYRLPAGALAATFDRWEPGNSLAFASGTLYLTAIILRAGQVLTNLNCRVGSTAVTGVTHSWMNLCDANRVVLRSSADDTTTPTGANVTKTFPLTSTYTIVTTGLYYLGTMFAATAGALAGLQGNANTILQIPPQLFGSSNTGMTTPSAEGTTMNALGTGAISLYGWVS